MVSASPERGSKQSLNVSAASGIALHAIRGATDTAGQIKWP